MLIVEPLGEVEQAGIVDRRSFGHGHAHVEVLARVAHLRVETDVDVVVGKPGRPELLGRLLLEIAHQAADATDVDL